MPKSDFTRWMWLEAVERLSRAELMHRQLFTLRQLGAEAVWEPPVDVLETEDEILVFFALPGVDADSVEAVINDGALIVSGKRVLPDALRTALIHRLELPQGRFERQVPLPKGVYNGVSRQALNGCLLIRLHKSTT